MLAQEEEAPHGNEQGEGGVVWGVATFAFAFPSTAASIDLSYGAAESFESLEECGLLGFCGRRGRVRAAHVSLVVAVCALSGRAICAIVFELNSEFRNWIL